MSLLIMIEYDPQSFSHYSTISEIIRGAYANQNVRIIGKINRIDKTSNRIIISYENSQIECSIPNSNDNLLLEKQLVQVIGHVQPVFLFFNPRFHQLL